MTISTVASTGDQLKTLIELRDITATRIELCQSDQNYGTLARVFLETLDKIAVLEGRAKGNGGTALDELAKRRAAAGRPDASSKTRTTRSAK